MKYFLVLLSLFLFFALSLSPTFAGRRKNLTDFQGKPPIHIQKDLLQTPSGITPDVIKKIYNLPTSGGSGTIAIVDAYDYPQAEDDLNIFSNTFSLPSCTKSNGCLEQHKMSAKIKKDIGWDREQALDMEWAHSIAPKAKILLVEAVSASGPNLLAAIDYARKRADVVAVSLSWGGPEFETEGKFDSIFVSPRGATFFASAGDSGAGVEWPAASPNVIAVGGTRLQMDDSGKLLSEIAWTGSGGGVSQYEKEPAYQIDYEVPDAKNGRAVPDVAYNADPASGFAVYNSSNFREKGWMVVGGTSAGAPQWAAIRALGSSFILSDLYTLAASEKGDSIFRDILSGKNGTCRYYCKARKGFDYITGLGSPLFGIFGK